MYMHTCIRYIHIRMTPESMTLGPILMGAIQNHVPPYIVFNKHILFQSQQRAETEGNLESARKWKRTSYLLSLASVVAAVVFLGVFFGVIFPNMMRTEEKKIQGQG